eukprot:5085482-Alexandrium_andersonii.AAC.1
MGPKAPKVKSEPAASVSRVSSCFGCARWWPQCSWPWPRQFKSSGARPRQERVWPTVWPRIAQARLPPGLTC